jgi:hypothetical protein
MGMACVGSGRKVFSIDNFSERDRYQDWLYKNHPQFDRIPWAGETASRFVQTLGLQRYVKLVNGDSWNSSLVPGPVDMVWIDAGHTYDAVLADIRAWKGRATKILCGHDYDIPDVARAVQEVLPGVRSEGRIWVCEKR